jgi:UDP-N-acetyl-D-galactosamine dehydrogenase
MVQFVKNIIDNKYHEKYNVNIALLGVTFKGNCNDARNSKAIELAEELNDGYNLTLVDPYVETLDINNYRVQVQNKLLQINSYDCIIVGANHDEFKTFFDERDNYKEIITNNVQIIDLCNLKPQNLISPRYTGYYTL